MVAKLVVLGILSRHRQHGYELKKQIELEMQNIRINVGSIYHALQSFARDGLICEVEIPKSHERRPERRGFEITEKGKQELTHLLEQALEGERVLNYNIDAAIHFLNFLPMQRSIALLKKRLSMLQTRLNELCAKLASLDEENLEYADSSKAPEQEKRRQSGLAPMLARSETMHQIMRIETEVKWLKKLIRELKTFQKNADGS